MLSIIKHSLSIIKQEIATTHLKLIQDSINLLNQQEKEKFSKKVDLILSEIETKFGKATDIFSDRVEEFTNKVSPKLEALVNQGWGDIYWEQVIKFNNEVSAIIDQIITTIFEDRVKLAIQAVEQAIAFYNDFLEQQERYQQETPEQREAEKAWIAQQRRKLARVQNGIEAILSQGAG